MTENDSNNAEFVEYLNFLIVERGLSKNTIDAYRRDLSAFTTYLEIVNGELLEIDPLTLEGYVSLLRSKGKSESSIARAVVSIRNCIDFYARESKTINPIKEFKPPKSAQRLPKALSIEEVNMLIDATTVSDDSASIRNRALVELLYATGARISEIVSLNLSDVSKLEGEEVLSVRLAGKGGKERIVPVGRFAQTAIDQYVVRVRPSQAKLSEIALFVNERGTRLSRQTMWKIISSAAKSACIDHVVSPHSLRHSFATHLLDGGADVRVVQELLGHSSVTTTQIYTLVTIDKLRENYSQAHPRARE
jgi:integrase/recombinase XerD